MRKHGAAAFGSPHPCVFQRDRACWQGVNTLALVTCAQALRSFICAAAHPSCNCTGA